MCITVVVNLQKTKDLQGSEYEKIIPICQFVEYECYNTNYIYKRVLNLKNQKLPVYAQIWQSIVRGHPELELNNYYYIQKLDEFLNIIEKYV